MNDDHNVFDTPNVESSSIKCEPSTIVNIFGKIETSDDIHSMDESLIHNKLEIELVTVKEEEWLDVPSYTGGEMSSLIDVKFEHMSWDGVSDAPNSATIPTNVKNCDLSSPMKPEANVDYADDVDFDDDNDDNDNDYDQPEKPESSYSSLSSDYEPSDEDKKVRKKSFKRKSTKLIVRSGKCEICNKTFVNLDRHQSRKHNGKTSESGRPFACDHAGCDKSFRLPAHLRLHKTYHSKRGVICDKCGSCFFFPQDLRRHMLSHSDQRPFKCHICNQSYKDASYLKTHIERHSGSKPYPCTYEGCDKMYATQSGRMLHVRYVHTGEKPYQCEHCDSRFADNSTFKQHLRMHTGDRPYKCHLCGKGHTQAGNLKSHLRHAHKTIVKNVSMYPKTSVAADE